MLKRLQRGFTLIELMIVVAIIGILALVAVPAFMDYMKKSKKSEASLQLNKIGKNLKVYYITESKFPAGEVALTPSESCCNTGGKCLSTPDTWKQPVWQALDFQIDEPSLFQYSYESDGKTFTAKAVGDLDCDGVMITYELRGTSDGGAPRTMLTEPAPNAD